MPASAEIFIAGGSLRNLIIDLLHGHAPLTRDIDIFIGGLDRDFSLSGIDFTVNAVIYDYYRKMLFENGCTAIVRDRVIDFNSHVIPDKQLIGCRILLMDQILTVTPAGSAVLPSPCPVPVTSEYSFFSPSWRSHRQAGRLMAV